MYTIREINVIDGVNSVNHVWFLVKTLEEAEEHILKRCFRAFKNPITGEYGQYIEKIKWYNGSKDGWTRSCLMLFKENDMLYELDSTIGPENLCRYVITEED